MVLTTRIHAPIERCFDLARDVEVHCQTAAFTGERVLPPGRTTGVLEYGDTVIFEGRHFGIRWRLTARIVEMQPPARFVDEIVNGVFRRLRHVHEFTHTGGVTTMVDTLDWQAPLGLLGVAADRLFVEAHLRRFLSRKQHALKALAERHRDD